MKTRVFAFFLLINFLIYPNLCFAFRQPDRPMLPDFDNRLPARAPVLDATREAAANVLRARIPTVRIDLDGLLACPNWILNTAGYLSGPDFPDPPGSPPMAGRNATPLLSVPAAQADPYRAIRRFL